MEIPNILYGTLDIENILWLIFLVLYFLYSLFTRKKRRAGEPEPEQAPIPLPEEPEIPLPDFEEPEIEKRPLTIDQARVAALETQFNNAKNVASEAKARVEGIRELQWIVSLIGVFERKLNTAGARIKKLKPDVTPDDEFEPLYSEVTALKGIFERLCSIADNCKLNFDAYRFASAMTNAMFSDISGGDRFSGSNFYYDRYVPIFTEPDTELLEGFTVNRFCPVLISRNDLKNPLYHIKVLQRVLESTFLQSTPLTGEIAKVVSKFFDEHRNLENVSINRSDAIRIVYSYIDAITLDICATLVLADSYVRTMSNRAYPFAGYSFAEIKVDPVSRTGISHVPPLVLRCTAAIKCLEWMGIKSEAHLLRNRLSEQLSERGGYLIMTDDFESMQVRLNAESFIHLFEMISAEILATSFDSLNGMTLLQVFNTGRSMAVREKQQSALKSFSEGTAELGHPLGLLQAAVILASKREAQNVGELLYFSVLRREPARVTLEKVTTRPALPREQGIAAEDFAEAVILAEILSSRPGAPLFKRNYDI